MTLPLVNINTAPRLMAMRTGAMLAYSGNWGFTQWQFSIAAINANTGQFTYLPGISKAPAPPFSASSMLFDGQPPHGDFHQTIIGIAASSVLPRWVVATGAPGVQSEPEALWGLQVWKWEGAWRWKGLIDARIDRLGTPRIQGDWAYAKEPGTNGLWTAFDLLNMTVGGDLDVPPTGEVQPNVNGYTYDIAGSGQIFTATRQGGITLPTYCPNDYVTRKQMAVFLLKTKYGSSYTPPPATGLVFSDVPASDPFAAWIEQLAAEGITAGKSPCEKP